MAIGATFPCQNCTSRKASLIGAERGSKLDSNNQQSPVKTSPGDAGTSWKTPLYWPALKTWTTFVPSTGLPHAKSPLLRSADPEKLFQGFGTTWKPVFAS